MRPDEIDQQPSAQGTIDELRRLRAEHPDAQIATELIRLDDAIVVIRASITLPNAGSATGFGATSSGGPAAVETAETRALSRALALLGYGSVVETKPAPAPVAALAPVAPFVPEITREPIRQEPEREPEPVRAVPPTAPVASTSPAPSAPRPAAPAPIDDDLELADYSWTEFWKWAKTTEYKTKPVVEELIGQSINDLNPAQVRSLMRSKADIP
jgi:hypothetical protein